MLTTLSPTPLLLLILPLNCPPHTTTKHTNPNRAIDALNRERKLQQSAAGSELRVLEDQYYSALRKNLEISAACQAVEDDMALLQARIDRLDKKQQQNGEAGGDEQQQQQSQEQQQQPLQQNGVDGGAAAEAEAAGADDMQ